MTHTHLAIDYIELGAPDLDAAKAFYGQVFGWRFNDYGPSYAGIQSVDGDREVGGLDAGTVPSSGGPLVLLYSNALDETVAAIIAGGGEIVQGPYAFPGGRRVHFRDVAGNQLGVWSAS